MNFLILFIKRKTRRFYFLLKKKQVKRLRTVMKLNFLKFFVPAADALGYTEFH